MFRHDQPVFEPRDSSRFRSLQFNNLAIVVGIILGIIGLSWLAADVSHPENNDNYARAEPPGGGTIVDVKVTDVCVPRAYLDLCEDPSLLAALESHEAAQAYLRERGLTKSWYAFTSILLQANGGEEVTTNYTRPFAAPFKLPEFRAILDTLAGNTPQDFQGDFSEARIRILPERLAASEPSAISAELVEWINSQEGKTWTIERTVTARKTGHGEQPRDHTEHGSTRKCDQGITTGRAQERETKDAVECYSRRKSLRQSPVAGCAIVRGSVPSRVMTSISSGSVK